MRNGFNSERQPQKTFYCGTCQRQTPAHRGLTLKMQFPAENWNFRVRPRFCKIQLRFVCPRVTAGAVWGKAIAGTKE